MDDEQTVRSALPAVMAQTLLQPAATRGAAATHDLNRLNLLTNLHGHASGLPALSYFDQAAVECTEIVHGRQVGAPAQRIWLKGCDASVTSESEDALWTPVTCTGAGCLSKGLNRRHPETTPSTLTRNDVAPCGSRYQRLTTPALSTMPDQAGVVCELKKDHSVKRLDLARVAA